MGADTGYGILGYFINIDRVVVIFEAGYSIDIDFAVILEKICGTDVCACMIM